MPAKWEIVNGSKYAVDDHSSPRSSPEEYNPYEDPEFLRRMSNLQADMRGSKKGGTLDDNLYPRAPTKKKNNSRLPGGMSLRTRSGTDFRKLAALRRQSAIMIQKHVRGMLARGNEDAENIGEQEQCHPVGWTKKNHYSELGWMWCGQSCPCCRTQRGDKLGGCPICEKLQQ